MAENFVYGATRFHQIITDFMYPASQIRWLHEKKRWTAQQREAHHNSTWLHILLLAYRGIAFSLSVFILAYLHARSNEIPHSKPILAVTTTLIFVCLGDVVVEALLYQYKYELAGAANWANTKRNQWLDDYKINGWKCSTVIAILTFVSSYVLTGLVAVISIGIVFMNMDPVYVLQLAFDSTNPTVWTAITVTRFAYIIHIAQVLMVNTRTIMIISKQEYIPRFALMHLLAESRVSTRMVRLYKELQIVSMVKFKFEVAAVTFFLSVAFFVIIFAAGLAMYGYKRHNMTLSIPILMIASLVFFVLMSLFYVGGSIYELSSCTAQKWRDESRRNERKNKDAVYLAKLAKHLRLIAIPAGTVGIIDKDIKMNYLNKVLDSVVSVIMAVQDA